MGGRSKQKITSIGGVFFIYSFVVANHKQPFWAAIHFPQRKNSLREIFLIQRNAGTMPARIATRNVAGGLKKTSSLPEEFLWLAGLCESEDNAFREQ